MSWQSLKAEFKTESTEGPKKLVCEFLCITEHTVSVKM